MGGIKCNNQIEEQRFDGKYGSYRLGKYINEGGNGKVYFAIIDKRSNDLSDNAQYVIKVFKEDFNSKKEQREKRFRNEIPNVLNLQENVEGIIRICDYFQDESSQELWYLMPLAKKYLYWKYPIIDRLRHMLQLGKTLQQIHKLGYAHRDIKPGNILWYQDRICLSDFGLVWKKDGDEHITLPFDRLGPILICPPELMSVGKLVEDVDYRKSDVYLYAKTVWIVLQDINTGFQGEYNRANNEIGFDNSKLKVETSEPLHQMMEGATKYNWKNRVDIEECIRLMEEQISIFDGTATEPSLSRWKYQEKARLIEADANGDKVVYENSVAILRIINNFANSAKFSIYNNRSNIPVSFSLTNGYKFEESVCYELVIRSSLVGGKKKEKTIKLVIKNITLTMDSLVFDIHLGPLPTELQYKKQKIEDAFQNEDRTIYLSDDYTIKIEPLE